VPVSGKLGKTYVKLNLINGYPKIRFFIDNDLICGITFIGNGK
jgi:hypothetical protein